MKTFSILLFAAIMAGSNLFKTSDETVATNDNFCRSFLIQPDLFLRLRPGKEKIVIQKLKLAGIDFKMIADTCLALPNASKIDEVVELDKEVVVQDENSP